MGRYGHAEERACTGSFVSRVFICFLKAGILREVLGEDLNRIFISFPGVSFNMMIHQNEQVYRVSVMVSADWLVLG